LSQPARAGIGIRHGNAARTGREANPHRCCGWIDCALPPVSKRQFMASHRAAACTEAPRRRAGRGREPAPSRFRVPCHGPAWSGCLGIRDARVFLISFANAKTKMPPAWSPRAFAVPRKIGATDLPWRSRSGQGCAFIREPRAQARVALGKRRHGAIGDVVRYGHVRSEALDRDRMDPEGCAPYSHRCACASEISIARRTARLRVLPAEDAGSSAKAARVTALLKRRQSPRHCRAARCCQGPVQDRHASKVGHSPALIRHSDAGTVNSRSRPRLGLFRAARPRLPPAGASFDCVPPQRLLRRDAPVVSRALPSDFGRVVDSASG